MVLTRSPLLLRFPLLLTETMMSSRAPSVSLPSPSRRRAELNADFSFSLRYRSRNHLLLRRCLAERPCGDHCQRASPALLPLRRRAGGSEADFCPSRALSLQDQGNRTTPSYVAFTETERLIGDSAKCVKFPASLEGGADGWGDWEGRTWWGSASRRGTAQGEQGRS